MELTDAKLERRIIRTLVDLSIESVDRARLALESLSVDLDAFGTPAHAETFHAVRQTVAAGQPVDHLTLWARLQDSPRIAKLGGRPWLDALVFGEWNGSMMLDAGQALAGQASALQDLAIRRRMVAAAKALLDRATSADADPNEVLAKASQHLAGLQVGAGGMVNLSTVLEEVGQRFDAIQAGEKPAIIPTGIPVVDEVIGGLQATLIVLGAYPGVGKSGTLARIVMNVARAGNRPAVVSLEDDRTWLPWRFLASESGVPQFALSYRQLNGEQRDRAVDAFEAVDAYAKNVWIDDRQGMTPAQVVASLRDAIVNHGCNIGFVDHLREAKYANKQRRDLEIAEFLSELRGLTKTYQVPIVVLSQLKRRKDTDDGPPRLDDFADASAVEQIARVAFALKREYGTEDLEIHFLKHTKGKGPGAFVRVRFDGPSAMATNEEYVPPVEEPSEEKPKRGKKKTDAPQRARGFDEATESEEP